MLENDLKNLIEEFLTKSGFHFDSLDILLDINSGSYNVSLRSNDSRHIIGRDGECLQNINFLIRRIVEKKHGDVAPRVSIDINGFQKEKNDRIKMVAHMMAERARFFKSRIELDPMNAYERRIVHEYVSNHPDLVSESAGSGRMRHVVISWKKE